MRTDREREILRAGCEKGGEGGRFHKPPTLLTVRNPIFHWIPKRKSCHHLPLAARAAVSGFFFRKPPYSRV